MTTTTDLATVDIHDACVRVTLSAAPSLRESTQAIDATATPESFQDRSFWLLLNEVKTPLYRDVKTRRTRPSSQAILTVSRALRPTADQRKVLREAYADADAITVAWETTLRGELQYARFEHVSTTHIRHQSGEWLISELRYSIDWDRGR